MLLVCGVLLWVGIAALIVITTSAKTAKKHDTTFSLPESAIEVAPGVFSLGKVKHNGMLVEGYAYVHYKENKAEKQCINDNVCLGWEKALNCDDCTSGGGDEEGDSTCYGFLSKDTYWKTIEPYVVNPSNIPGLNEDDVVSILGASIGKWETAAGTDIIGSGSTIYDTLVADRTTPDGINEVYFADIESSNAIGVTIVWGNFGGPPPFRQLVEWDQIYDDFDFDWSLNGEEDKMDFENIATHELGHSVGMGDLYTSDCAEQTMYGYASYGEIEKRSLKAGDIAGVAKLYE